MKTQEQIELINDTSNALYNIDTIEYYNNVEVESNLYYNFINTGSSNIDLTLPVIEKCNVTVFDDLSKQGLNPAQKTHIHPMTLRTWIKNRIENGQEIDYDVFGVYVGNRAKIKGGQ